MKKMDANDLTWVRCNRCLLIFVHHVDKVKFWMTNCGHIFCHVCMNHGSSQPNCYVCQAPQPNVIQLERNIRPELQANFSLIDIGVLQRLMIAAKFQEKHEQWNFERAFQGLSKKGQFLKQAYGAVQRMRRNYNETKSCHQQLKREVEELRSKIEQLKEKQRRILHWEKAVEVGLERKRQKARARRSRMNIRPQTKAFSPIESGKVYRHSSMNFQSPPKFGIGDENNFLQSNNSQFNFGLQLQGQRTMMPNNPHCVRQQYHHHRHSYQHPVGHHNPRHQPLSSVQVNPNHQRYQCFGAANAQHSRTSARPGHYQPFQLQPGMTPSSKLPEFNAPLNLKL